MFFRKYRYGYPFFSAVLNPVEIVGALEPINYLEEKKKWLNSPGKTYNPQFIYDETGIRHSLHLAKKLRRSIDNIVDLYIRSSDWRSILTSELLLYQREDLDAIIPFLESFAKGMVPDSTLADKTVSRLFGAPTQSELDVIAELAIKEESHRDIILKYLIGENERSIYSKTKLETVLRDYFHDFKGILTPAEFDALSCKRISIDQIVEITKTLAEHIDQHMKSGNISIQINLCKETDVFGVCRHALSSSHYIFEVPKIDGYFAGDFVLQVFAHELNSHLRAHISTGELAKKLPNHFQPYIVSRNQRMLVQEGFASLNGETVLDEKHSMVFEPMLVLGAAYAKAGHNFAETVHHIYETYKIDPDVDNFSLHNDIWSYSQIFNGIADTSAHGNYAFPWKQVYMIGPLRTLREICRKDDNYFEDPLSMMRYSELPLKLIRIINHIENDLKQKLAPDPFEAWDYAHPDPAVRDITEFTKQLLLDL